MTSHRLRSTLAALALCAAAGSGHAGVGLADVGSFSGATVLDFEDVAAGASLGGQYAAQGIADFNAPVLGAVGDAKVQRPELLLVPGAVSGSQIAFVGASIRFEAPVERVGAWLYTGNGTQYLNALDEAQNVLFSATFRQGATGRGLYEFVGVASDAADIRYVVIANRDLSSDTHWDVSGPTTFFDDLTFSRPVAPVPEPETYVMMAAGFALVVAASRRGR